ncbi:MAG: His/Gly/Thr/Pro-type tRNA ligase C-terminal domain-containing protein [Patescibacteria group bacterium]|nr:His/Gly/Thr/Pro-type tRNA ligase C-terminal domain-containing protein [Patescibacteria group bacterium]
MKATQILRTSKSDLKASTVHETFLLKGNFIQKLGAGIYQLMPLGFLAYQKIYEIIDEELKAIGFLSFRAPIVHPASIWEKSGRYDDFGPEMVKFKNRSAEKFVLAPTHEEPVNLIAKKLINSYKDLPLALNQIQTKFRDEPRARGGLIRLREFTMQDGYSFHTNQEDLDKFYNDVRAAYLRIFKRLGFEVKVVAATSGAMGGSGAEEFMILAQDGSDQIAICEKCDYAVNIETLVEGDAEVCEKCGGDLKMEKTIELGHIFKLGDKYTKAFELTYDNEKGEKKYPVSGCYGIGLERALASIVETHHDDKGIIWPSEVAPFDYYLIALGEKANEEAKKLYEKLAKEGKEILFDDRENSAGEKFADADLIGCPKRLVISDKTLANNQVEIKDRATGAIELKNLSEF